MACRKKNSATIELPFDAIIDPCVLWAIELCARRSRTREHRSTSAPFLRILSSSVKYMPSIVIYFQILVVREFFFFFIIIINKSFYNSFCFIISVVILLSLFFLQNTIHKNKSLRICVCMLLFFFSFSKLNSLHFQQFLWLRLFIFVYVYFRILTSQLVKSKLYFFVLFFIFYL